MDTFSFIQTSCNFLVQTCVIKIRITDRLTGKDFYNDLV